MNIHKYEDFIRFQYVSRETYKKFIIYYELLNEWQKKMNLVGNSTIKNSLHRHFLDSAQLYTFVRNVEGNIIDFGSGAGFPGMVLAIMGKRNIHLVESDHKKCVFLKEIAMLTETDITIHNCKIEDLSFINVDLITCRALASLSKLIDHVEIFINKSLGEKQELPKMLFLKGKSYYSEVVELSKNKKISFEEYPSITDRNGKILYISKVDKLDI